MPLHTHEFERHLNLSPTSTPSHDPTRQHLFITMSAVPAPVEKAAETVSNTVSNAVNDVAEALSNTNLNSNKAAANEAASASAAEGRRLYIGNLAYATTEEELKGFFKSYLV